MTGTPAADGSRRPIRVVLVGHMGAGKTTVGRLLAERLDARFIDLDHEIETLAGSDIASIFATEGEPGFRRREAAATADLVHSLASSAASDRPCVVAVGGGWMARPELRDKVTDSIRIWLDASVDTLRRRLGGTEDSRPMLGGAGENRLERLLAARRASYALAELRIETDELTPDEVADGILAALEG